MWELQRHQGDISYHDDLRKNNRQKTEGGDKHFEKSSSVSCRAEGQLMPYLQEVLEKHWEMQKELHMVFIDLEKGYDRVPRQEVLMCLREHYVPEKYVRLVKDTYEEARTEVKTSIGLTGKTTVRVGLHQGSSLSLYLFDIILDMMGRSTKEQPPWCMLFADDIVQCSTRIDHVERELDEWRRAMQERVLNISRKKTGYLGCFRGLPRLRLPSTYPSTFYYCFRYLAAMISA